MSERDDDSIRLPPLFSLPLSLSLLIRLRFRLRLGFTLDPILPPHPPCKYGWQRRSLRRCTLLGSYVVSTIQEKHGGPLEMNAVPGIARGPGTSTCASARECETELSVLGMRRAIRTIELSAYVSRMVI